MLFVSSLITAILSASIVLAPPSRSSYPETRRVDHFDEYHGERVHDPYRWLEDDARESEDVQAWIDAQNKVTFSYLKSIPERARIESRLTELWNYEKFGTPFKVGGRYYMSKNDGLQNQNVIYRFESLDEEPVVLFDPNTWSDDGTVALAGMAFTEDGKYVAYGVAEAGSDWRTWKIREIESGRDLDDRIRWVKFSGAEWTPDGRGFFYGRYDDPGDAGGEFLNVNKFQKLYYHRIGTDQSEDVLVYQRRDEPDWMFGAEVTEDGRYLIISVSKGTDDKSRLLIKDLHEPYGLPVVLIDNFEAAYNFIDNDGAVFYFRTTLHAPRGRIIAIDLRQPEKTHWTELVAESEDVLRSAGSVGNMFVLNYLHDAVTAVRLHDFTGRFIREVEFPGIGSASGFGGKRSHTETFYSFSSFAVPPSIYHYDMITGESSLMVRADVDFNPDDYTTKQIKFSSKDGTVVPMFITHKKGITLDGNNPTLLYGYGGFNISLTPRFSVTRLAWMEMGGVFAQANMRGGGEYGEDWHKAGTKLLKQNVFDDFIAAAEWLINNDYTQPSRLAIQGGSNGGLLVGACMTQRPELFGACLPAVGVMDMLRFHKFTIGWAWTDDYGSSDNPEEFKALLAYSPYHNLTPGVKYPATMVTTADHDDRVVPGHSFKFAAALQYAQSGNAPTLIRIETRAGHGAGTPTSKRIEQAADAWAFLVDNLG
ncbi:MAG: S9 family peptidase, partial [Planctomycetes bacterium]|nr:S9 family peptidase [Planctomycetota bacterium]